MYKWAEEVIRDKAGYVLEYRVVPINAKWVAKKIAKALGWVLFGTICFLVLWLGLGIAYVHIKYHLI